MPPQGARRPDRATYDERDRLAGRQPGSRRGGAAESRPSGASSLESRGIRQRDPRPARSRRRRARRSCRRTIRRSASTTSPMRSNTSPALLQAYLAAARKISTVAVGDPRVGAGSDTYSVGQDLSQDEHLEGLPLGTVGGLAARHTFPVDGEYDIPDQALSHQPERHSRSSGASPARVDAGRRAHPARPISAATRIWSRCRRTRRPPPTPSRRQRLRLRVFVKAGRRAARQRVPRRNVSASRDQSPAALRSRLQPLRCRGRRRTSSRSPSRARSMRHGPGIRSSDRLFVCRPSTPADEAGVRAADRRRRGDAGPIAGRCRTTKPRASDVLLSEGPRGRSVRGRHRIRAAVRPRQSRRSSSAPKTRRRSSRPGTPYRIADYELASRLSFFLWSSIPDDDAAELWPASGRLAPAGGAGASGPAHAGRSARRRVRPQLRRPMAAAAQPASGSSPTRISFRTSTTTCGRPSSARRSCSSTASSAKIAARST